MNVRQDREPVADERLGGLQRARDVGKQGLVVADDFQLDETADAGLARQPAGTYRVRGGVAAGRVGQDGVAFRIDVVEQIFPILVGDVHAPNRDGHDLGPGRLDRALRFGEILVFAGADDQSGAIFLAGQNERVVHGSLAA